MVAILLLAIVYGCCIEDVRIDAPEYENDTTLRLAQWNIGHFSFGNLPYSGIGQNIFKEKLHQYREMLDSINADIVSICEYSEVFGEDKTGERYARDVLFNDFSFSVEGPQYNYSCNALFSHKEVQNIQIKAFENVRTNYYYLTADLPINKDVIVKLVCTHLAFSSDNDKYALIQVEELLQEYENDEYVIMMGDWNIKDVENFKLFVRSGYQLANHGGFGDIETFTDLKNVQNRVLDNIMTKGVVIKEVSVIPVDLSDHYPLVVSIHIKTQNELGLS